MTGILQRKAQWEQQAREDERRQIVEFLKTEQEKYTFLMKQNEETTSGYWLAYGQRCGVRDAEKAIESGEYRKAKSE